MSKRRIKDTDQGIISDIDSSAKSSRSTHTNDFHFLIGHPSSTISGMKLPITHQIFQYILFLKYVPMKEIFGKVLNEV